MTARPLVHRCRLLLAGLAAMLVLLAGCSVDSKKAGHLAKADAFFAAGNYSSATIEYRNVIKIDPRNVHSLTRMGVIAFEQGRLGRAMEALSYAKVLAPNDSTVRRTLGQLNLAVGYRAQATEEANFILGQNPNDPEAPVLLAEAAYEPDSIASARQRLLALLEKSLNRAPVLVALGILEAREGKLAEATERFVQAVAADPTYPEAHAALGAVQSANNEVKSADASLARAAELSGPRSPQGVQYALFKENRGDARGARTILEAMVAKAPDYLPAQLRLVDLATREGRLDAAAALLGPILASDPNHAEALLMGSRLALARNQANVAQEKIHTLLLMYPQSHEALHQQALVYLGSNDEANAEISLLQALASKPDHRESILELAALRIRQGSRTAAIALLRPWLEKSPSNETPPSLVSGYLLLAEALQGQGEFTEALAIYERVERAAPGSEQLPVIRGLILRELGQPERARAALLEALSRNPDSPIAIEQLVELDLDSKDSAGARRRIEAALDRRPTAPELVLLSARLHLFEGDPTEATTALQRAISLQPGFVSAHKLLARLKMTAGDRPGALETLRTVTELDPRDPDAWFLSGVLQEQLGEPANARAAYERLLALNPRHTSALNNLARLLFDSLNEPRRAYDLGLQARDLSPDDPDIAANLGWIVYHQGNYIWARGLLLESAAKLTGSREVHYRLAMTHYMLVEESAARKAFETVLALTGPFQQEEASRARLTLLGMKPSVNDREGVALLEQRLQENPKDPIVLCHQAALQRIMGNNAGAIELYERAIQAVPQAVRPLIELAELLIAQGKMGPALERARRARELAPDDAQIAFELGRIAYQLRDFTWSFNLLQEAARRVPENPEVLLAFANAAYSVGRIADARAALITALRLEPSPSERERLQLIDASASRSSALPAVLLATRRLEASPADVAARMVLATAEPAGSRPQLERILEIYPEFAPAKRNLALLLAIDPAADDRTLQLGSQARDVIRDDGELDRTLGQVAYRRGDLRRAAYWLASATSHFPDEALLWFQLGMSQSEINEEAAAVVSFEKALSLTLPAPQAKQARGKLATLK